MTLDLDPNGAERKMTEATERESIIPKWANDKAQQVIEMFSQGDNAYIDRALLHGAFAAALVQERERCGKIAQHEAEDWKIDGEMGKFRACFVVADLIRGTP